jgi:hypothetical protein
MFKSLNIPDAQDPKEAAAFIFAGFLFFLMKKPIRTVLVLAFLLTGPAYIAWDWATSYRVQVKKAKPAQAITNEDAGSLLSLSSLAYAGKPPKPCKDSILIHGVFYGCQDKSLEAYAILGTEKWIIHDHETKQVYDVEFPFFRDEKKEYRQKK